ncbi:MAG: FtsX-like permease family protein [Phycisphaerales bacterium]|nr:FtsX-like permease family protein [Phycisphaerales bacterium]
MRAAWRLAISSLSQRPSRSILLLLVVALSAALVCGVATAMASVTESLRARMIGAVGTADLKIVSPASAKPLDDALLATIRRWQEVDTAEGRLRAAAALRAVRPTWPTPKADDASVSPSLHRTVRSFAVNVYFESFRPGFDEIHRPVALVEGRMPLNASEIAVDQTVIDRLRGIESKAGRRSGTLSALISGTPPTVEEGTADANQDLGPESARDAADAAALNEKFRVALGQSIEFIPAGKPPMKLTIVGVAPYGVLGGRPRAWMTPDALAAATDQVGRFNEIEIILRPGLNPETVAAAHRAEMPDDTVLQSTAKVTSNLEQNLRANQLGLIVASTMAFLSASFIILTGMTTGVVERQRELAILRCIGAARRQIAASQIMVGLLIGTAGSLLGAPLGVAIASLVIWWFQTDFKIDLAFPWFGLAVGVIGSITAGLLGAAFPAWRAARMEPLKALTSRAEIPKQSSIWKLLAICVVMLLTHLVIVAFTNTPSAIFILYVSLALPCMFFGYFLLGVPLTAAVVEVAGPAIARLLGVPRTLLERSIRRTPYRHGFTAGALMAGLALMIAIWTQGASFAQDWLGKMQFPDAFVTGLALSDKSVDKLRSMKDITGATPLSIVRVEAGAPSIGPMRHLKTMFIGFDPDSFFSMMNITWVQGDKEHAQKRLNQGDAIIVAREFLASKGLGLGDRVTVKYQSRSSDFEIVGVVTSPGLDIVSNFFDLGDMYVDQAVSAVFGSRAALRDRLLGGGDPPTQLISLSLAKGSDDVKVAGEVRTAMMEYGVLDVGTGRTLKNVINGAIGRSLYIVSAIALMSMLVASLGVANLIVAAIEGRRFEFGVLRAVGASRWMVCRLVLAEAVVVALSAAILGTMMGLQGSYGGKRLNAVIAGIDLTLRPEFTPIATGWLIVIALTLLAAAPAVLALSRKEPRELLGAVRG